MDPAPQDSLGHHHQVDIKGKLNSADSSAGIGCNQDLGAIQSCKPKPGYSGGACAEKKKTKKFSFSHVAN
jgi:hypothetical protein